MKTNLEKWNYYSSELNKKANEFLDSINVITPETFWEVEPDGKITECFVLSRGYSLGIYFFGKKPTNKDVIAIKKLYETPFVFDEKKAYFEYKYQWGAIDGDAKFTTSRIGINKVFENRNVFINKLAAEIKAKEVIDIYNENKDFYKRHKKDVNYNYLDNGYKFLGWQNGWKHIYYDEDGTPCSESGKPHKSFGYSTADYPEYGKCRDLKHRHVEVQHNQRGSENTVSCPICKIFWKYDCSD